jgi:FkbM family methyltransferase
MKNNNKWFIEIGVGYENTLRKLIDNGWFGIMIDPQQESLNLLEPHPNLYKECVAIDTTSGIKNFISVKDLSIFDEPLIVAGMFGLETAPTPMHDDSYDEYRIISQVQTMRLDDIIKKYHLTEIDFLKIDVEGHDIPILMDYSFIIKPKVIKFEHIHHSGKIYDATGGGFDQTQMTKNYYELIENLEKMGYLVWEETNDVYCVL